jgi:hypothetical protein
MYGPDHIKEPKSRRMLPFTITAGNVTIGTFVKVQDTWGILWGADDCFGTDTMTIGKSGVVDFKCDKVKVPKETSTGSAFVIGDSVYFSATDKKVSNTKAGNYTLYCGVALEAATDAATHVLIHMDMLLCNLTAV